MFKYDWIEGLEKERGEGGQGGETRLIEHSAFHVIGYRESALPFKLILYFYPLFYRSTRISRLIYMLSAVSESSRLLGAESLFHTYCLIELRTSLALECKSPELNLDELSEEWGWEEWGRDRDRVCVCVCVCVCVQEGEREREWEAIERKFRITKCRIPLKKGEFEYLVRKEFYASLANVEIVCDSRGEIRFKNVNRQRDSVLILRISCSVRILNSGIMRSKARLWSD